MTSRFGTHDNYEQRHRALDWQDDAACTPEMADQFTTDKKLSATEIGWLTEVCDHCAVSVQCAPLGLTVGGSGVWAGVYVPNVGPGRGQARRLLKKKAVLA